MKKLFLILSAVFGAMMGWAQPKMENPSEKEFYKWMNANLGFAPVGFPIEHRGGFNYTWLNGGSVVWKGEYEGKAITASLKPDITPLLASPAPNCVCILNHEVSNGEYFEFVEYALIEQMKQMFPKEQFYDKKGKLNRNFLVKVNAFLNNNPNGADSVSLKIASIRDLFIARMDKFDFKKIQFRGLAIFPDTEGWIYNYSNSSWMEPFKEYYFIHPAYKNYPMVNITRPQAQSYCVWLGEKMSKISGDEVYFFLPTEMEWLQAASFVRENSKSDYQPNKFEYWRNSKGIFIANYNPGEVEDGDSATKQRANANAMSEGIVSMTSDGAMITTPVFSYGVNDAGCYQMFGNVGEMTATDFNGMIVVKGGSYIDSKYVLGLGSRCMMYPMEHSPFMGFRPVMKVKKKFSGD